jgi:hypothetical protein
MGRRSGVDLFLELVRLGSDDARRDHCSPVGLVSCSAGTAGDVLRASRTTRAPATDEWLLGAWGAAAKRRMPLQTG